MPNSIIIHIKVNMNGLSLTVTNLNYKIQTTKGSKSRFEMTHGHVSTSQILVYPLLPPLSQSILFSKKQRKNSKSKNRNPEWEPPLNRREEQCKEHMHEVGQQ